MRLKYDNSLIEKLDKFICSKKGLLSLLTASGALMLGSVALNFDADYPINPETLYSLGFSTIACYFLGSRIIQSSANRLNLKDF